MKKAEDLFAKGEIRTMNETITSDCNPSFEYIKMDYSLTTPEERKAKVEEIIANTPSERLTPYYLDKLASYLVIPIEKQEKKEKLILTDNHMKTVNKRELSFEGLVGKLENGEDGIYSMIANDKNILFTHKDSITEEDLETVPGLRELRDAIEEVERECKIARGRRAYLLKKQLIEMRQDQYVLRNNYKKKNTLNTNKNNNMIKSLARMDLAEDIYLDENGEVQSNGLVNLYNYKMVSMLLCNYSNLKEECWDRLNADMKWMMEDLDNLVEAALKDKYPLYYDLLIYKIDGLSNLEIQEKLNAEYGIKHSPEYISSLWRNKIPKLIAEEAANQWLVWHFTEEERGKWKKCSRCGQIKLAHNHFFSKNSTSKDHFYSICKVCRNEKNKLKKIQKKVSE